MDRRLVKINGIERFTYGLPVVKQILNMPKEQALKRIESLSPQNLFSPEELGSLLLLEEAAKKMTDYLEREIKLMADPSIEKALLERLEEIVEQLKDKIEAPVIRLSGQEERVNLLNELRETILRTGGKEASDGFDKLSFASMQTIDNIVKTTLSAKEEERAEILKKLMGQYRQEINDNIKSFIATLDEVANSPESSDAIAKLKREDPELVDDIADIPNRIKKIMESMNDFSNPELILKSFMLILKLVEAFDILLRKARYNTMKLKDWLAVKDFLDLNLEMEEQGLGIINPHSPVFSKVFVPEQAIRKIYSELHPRGQQTLNNLLMRNFGEKIYELSPLHATLEIKLCSIMAASALASMLDLGYFDKRYSIKISAAINELNLAELFAKTRAELKALLDEITRD